MSWIKSLRLKSNRINSNDKKYIFEGIRYLLEYKCINEYNIFLSGSHSKKGRKYPNKNSDIDIYIMMNHKDYRRVVKNDLGIEEKKEWSKALKDLTGFKIQIFIVDIKYHLLLKKQMEELK